MRDDDDRVSSRDGGREEGDEGQERRDVIGRGADDADDADGFVDSNDRAVELSLLDDPAVLKRCKRLRVVIPT